jgi:hypothetical protein
VEILLLPPPPRGVVIEDPSVGPAFVEPAEQRHDDEALDREREVRADHLTEPVGLALEREPVAGDLLVVLELELEKPDDLGGLARGAGDRDHRVPVGGEDLLDAVVGDRVALGGAPIAGEGDPAGELQANDRRPVGASKVLGRRGGAARDRIGTGPRQEVEEARIRPDDAARGHGRPAGVIRHSPPFWT